MMESFLLAAAFGAALYLAWSALWHAIVYLTGE